MQNLKVNNQMKSIYIYGASGHGLVVADIAKACGYEKIIFIDDGENQYLTFEEIKSNNKISIAFGIGDNKIRHKLFYKVEKFEFNIVSLIHPSAAISPNVRIDTGTVIMPKVVVNSNSKIGKGVILNSACIIEHENEIKDFVHISPGVSLGGDVLINEYTHIGIGSSIIQGLSVGENCIIGAGSVIVNEIGNNKLAYGNPCKEIKDLS